jgi:SHS2 domain-containing protein
MKKNYQLIEHTADIGIKVKGKDLKQLFKNAALAMFDIIAEKKDKPGKVKKEIKLKQSADDLDELFINWLNELLSLYYTKELIFTGFHIEKLQKDYLLATVAGASLKNFKINSEVKAATYHQLKIKESKKGWQAQVIFDV